MLRVLEHTEHTDLTFSSEHQETKTPLWCDVGSYYYWEIISSVLCQEFSLSISRMFLVVGGCYLKL